MVLQMAYFDRSRTPPAPYLPAVSSKRAGRSAALGERLPPMAPNAGLPWPHPKMSSESRLAVAFTGCCFCHWCASFSCRWQ
jgi:hypothetical protein